MTHSEFYDHISLLPHHYQNIELEPYLLALLKLATQHEQEEPTAELFMQLLGDAFTSEPHPFNPEWLTITEPPDQNVLSKKFTNPEIDPSFDKTVVSNKSGFEFTMAVLQFQIAELHKMEYKQLHNEMRYFGVHSETDNLWYNFDPMTNLECGARCLCDNRGDEKEMEANWQTLGELLEMGRIYE